MSTLAENDSLAVLQSLRTNNLQGFGATLTNDHNIRTLDQLLPWNWKLSAQKLVA